MLRKTILVVAMLVLFPVTAALSATSPESAKGGGFKPKRPRVAFSLSTLAEERWHRDLEQMELQANAMGIDLVIQLTGNDQNQQNFNIEQLITMGVDVLIIAPRDSFGVGDIVELAHDAGIKVISYDRLILNADVDLYVSYDNVAIGRLQGKYLAERAKKGKYILLAGPRYDSNANFYKDGAMLELQPLIDSGDIQVVLDRSVPNWSPTESKELVNTTLVKHPREIVAILAPNDGMAGGAISALKDGGLAGDVIVTGMDAELSAAKRVMEGSQAMTVFKDISKEVEAALHAALLLARGEDIGRLTEGRTINNLKRDVPAILLEPVVVDKENLNDVLLQAGHFTEKISAE